MDRVSGAGHAGGDLVRVCAIYGAVGDGVTAAGGVCYVRADDGEECRGVVVLAGSSAWGGAGGADNCAVDVCGEIAQGERICFGRGSHGEIVTPRSVFVHDSNE